MQRLFATCLFTLLMGFLCLPSNLALGQESQSVYVQLDYMKVPPGGGAEYLAMEQEIWKAIHQERISRGLLTLWALYSVPFAPADADYDYVTVNVFDDLSKLENTFAEEIVQTAHPDADLDAMMQRTESARAILHSEVWQLVDAVQAGEPSNYLVVNYMSVPEGGGEAYLAMEQEIAKPMHQVRIREGMMDNWELYQLMLPGGTSVPYNYATVDSYENIGDLGQGFATEAIAGQAYPGVSQQQVEMMWEGIPSTRSIYKSALWQLLDSVGADSPGSN